MAKQEPLRSLEELADWTEERAPELHVAPLAARGPRDPDDPKVLVCHDMQGGYLDDAFAYGNANDAAYRFFHFHLADLFVYFSHSLVTLPPVGWVDCCHRNGVPCLGTFIAEWLPGQLAMRQLLDTCDSAELYARQLARLAAAHKFDGWLVNVECDIASEQMPQLLHFVRRLRELSAAAGQQVVWYDSVCSDGGLRWQNCVCEENKDLALAAGAVFLNYCWSPQLLKDTVSFLDANGIGADALDVFVGVDCFGRGCPGGGGFNSDAAVRQIAEASPRLGVAVFAPAWPHETCESDSWDARLERCVDFWSRLQRPLGRPRPWVQRLNTAFCLGQGAARFDRGRLVATGAWNNLREAHVMPHYWDSGASTQHLTVCRSRGFQYGGCLRYSLSGGQCQDFPLFRLRLPAGRVKALKLVYSLDSVFDDRPLDPVTVCLVATFAKCRQGRVAAVCHSDSTRVDSFELAAARAHFADSVDSVVAFARTAHRDVDADCGVVWHVAYTQAADPDVVDDDAAASDAEMVSLSLFFLLPSRLELTAPINVYVGQVKVSVH